MSVHCYICPPLRLRSPQALYDRAMNGLSAAEDLFESWRNDYDAGTTYDAIGNVRKVRRIITFMMSMDQIFKEDELLSRSKSRGSRRHG